MRTIRRSVGALAGLLTGLLVLTGCTAGQDAAAGTTPASTQADEPVRGGELVIAVPRLPSNWDRVQSNPSPVVFKQITDRLLALDPETNEFSPYLATEWRVLDDGRRYEFDLRHDVTFSNGEALDAQVVKDNFDTTWALALAGKAVTALSFLGGYTGSEVVDEYTVAVSFEEPNAGFLQGATESTLAILAPETLAKTPEERAAGELIGSGPFVLSEISPNEKAVVTRREGYDWAPEYLRHAGEAYVDSITFQIVPESTVQVEGLLAGDFDSALILSNAKDVVDSLDQEPVDIVAADHKAVPYTLIPNTSGSVLSSERVRQAINLGIDRQQIVDNLWPSFVKPATDLLTQSHPDFSDHSELLAYEPEEAIALLEQDGWVLGADGVRAKDGTALSVSLTYSGTELEPTYQLIQTQLAQIGVRLELAPLTSAELTERLAGGDWELYGSNWGRADGNALLQVFDSSLQTGKGAAARPELDALLAEQSRTIDTEERTAIIEEFTTSFLEQAFAFPLVEIQTTWLFGQDVHGQAWPGDYWQIEGVELWVEQ